MDPIKSTCIRCKFPDVEEGDIFCRNCSYPIDGNMCTNEECSCSEGDTFFPTTNCFCPECGQTLSHYEDGLIEPLKFD